MNALERSVYEAKIKALERHNDDLIRNNAEMLKRIDRITAQVVAMADAAGIPINKELLK